MTNFYNIGTKVIKKMTPTKNLGLYSGGIFGKNDKKGVNLKQRELAVFSS
jgi:hypothetical protein